MRLTWRRSDRAEDRFETWLAQLYQQRVLEGREAAPGSCPDKAFLRELARKSNRIALSDPRVDHAASCPMCMKRLLALRSELWSRRRKLILAVSAASCLVIAVACIYTIRSRPHSQPLEANNAIVTETVNLWDARTLRGQQPQPLRSVSLPAAVVRASVVLPRFSEPGLYVVAVSRDQAGNDVLAEGSGASNTKGDHEEVSVDLDLRKAAAGSYFLSTTHEQDQAAYFYPLQIK